MTEFFFFLIPSVDASSVGFTLKLQEIFNGHFERK